VFPDAILLSRKKRKKEDTKMLRIRHTGGEKAEKGNYWNFETGERVMMSEAGKLPGNEKTVYYKANPIVILAAGPVLGLLYAAFLPFIGIAIVAKVAVQKLMGLMEGSAEGLSRVSTFNWSPAKAYLASRRSKKAEMKAKAAEVEEKNKKNKE
jgi:hypothetical protein